MAHNGSRRNKEKLYKEKDAGSIDYKMEGTKIGARENPRHKVYQELISYR